MKKIIALSLALTGTLILGGCSLSGTQNNSSSNAPKTSGTAPTTPVPAMQAPSSATTEPAAAVASNAVNIQNFSFNPDTITVKKGTTVTWTNNDSAPHQIKTATFNSSQLSKGQTFSFTFNTAGTFDYSCAIHPSMLGKVIVE